MARLKYWVWLSGIGGVRPYAKSLLLEALGGPEKIFFAEREELLSVEGVQPKEAERFSDKSMESAERTLEFCQREGISILTLQDAEYPENLRAISDPPAVLYIKGRLPAVDDVLTVGIVGTRKASPYGLKMAAKLGKELALAGAVVVSGLAEGCDSAAMEAALLAGGLTVGVLGTAINEVYPAKNRPLFEAVCRQGAVISEYPPKMRTYPADFKARNRIISGLSSGIAVAEAPLRSGTRNTVEHALSQGRDVFAVPGNADAAASAGCNELIAEGACVASCGGDILAMYEGSFLLTSVKKEPTPIKKEIDKQKDLVYIDLTEVQENLPPVQRTVLSVMTRPDMLADEIIEAAGLPAAEVLSAITMLQLTGHITAGSGKHYSRRL